MSTDIPNLQKRMRYAEERIDELKAALSDESALSRDGLCTYITGSYGRLEAHEFSDLDLFFISTGKSSEKSLSHVDKVMFDYSLIAAARKLKFPEFTKGGEYLQVHFLDDILEHMGSPKDDHLNYFTARMLLLLESIPLINESAYDIIISNIIDSYYRDYHDHEINFEPAFLVNDIHRYWITMCLNYEHARNKANRSQVEKNESHLKNIKLKFSRLLTCYSMIVPILSFEGSITRDKVIELTKMTPIRRLLCVIEENNHLSNTIAQVLECYDWFWTSQEKKKMQFWIGLEWSKIEITLLVRLESSEGACLT